MPAFTRLLSVPDSRVAAALRLGLHGLQATLREAVEQAPTDPGSAAGRDLLQELARLFQEAGQQTRASVRGLLEGGRRPAVSSLARLRQEIEGSRHLQERLGPVRLRSTTDAGLWGEVQRLFLRLGPAEGLQWSRRALELARQAGPLSPPRHLLALRDEADEEVYPGLAGVVEAPGMRLSPAAPLHPLLAGAPREGEAARFAADVSFCLHFLEWDASLHHALEAVRPLGVHPLTGTHREAYTRELLARFQRLSQAEGQPLEALRAALALDEAIHALVHLPPAERLSWWQQRQQRARQRLDGVAERVRQAGHRVHLRWLTGPYRQVKSYSKNDWGLEAGGNLGEVLVCLRVYAEVDGQAFPGRVIYRDY